MKAEESFMKLSPGAATTTTRGPMPETTQNLVKVSPKDLKAKKAKGGPNRSDFIRQHPNLSPNEVVEAGRKAGLVFSRNLVYLVRGPRGSETKAPAKHGPGRPKKNLVAPVSVTVKTPPASKASSSDVEQLARLALAVGLDKAENLLKKLRAVVG